MWSLQMGRSHLQQTTGVFLSAFDGHLVHLYPSLGSTDRCSWCDLLHSGSCGVQNKVIDVVSCLGKLFNSLRLSICGSKKDIAISIWKSLLLSWFESLCSGNLILKMTLLATNAISKMLKNTTIGHLLVWRFVCH